MRQISYAGTVFFTGDEIAETLLDYARVLASNRMADTVFVPAKTRNGLDDRVELLIGPSSQIVSEAIELFTPDITDEALLSNLRERIRELNPLQPRHESAEDAHQRHADDDY